MKDEDPHEGEKEREDRNTSILEEKPDYGEGDTIEQRAGDR